MSVAFAPWQQRTFTRALEARSAGRLPHALLICGPELLGKRALAEALAQALVCTAPTSLGDACGACNACRMFVSRYQRDPVETRPDDSRAHPDGHPGHPDVRFISFALNEKSSPKKMYQELVIEQIREISAWLVLSPQTDRGKVVLIDPAHLLTTAAANALLKTLEEPIPGRYLILVSDQPHRLPATIRSRCQRLEVKLPPREEARAWLLADGTAARQADEALAASLGHPGLARRELQEQGAVLRTSVAKDLVALAAARERAAVVAQRWIEDRPAQRLQIAAGSVRDFAARHAGGDGDSALAQAGLPAELDQRPLAIWFDEANRVQSLLRTTLRQDLLLGELLRQWREACRPGAAAVLRASDRR